MSPLFPIENPDTRIRLNATLQKLSHAWVRRGVIRDAQLPVRVRLIDYALYRGLQQCLLGVEHGHDHTQENLFNWLAYRLPCF